MTPPEAATAIGDPSDRGPKPPFEKQTQPYPGDTGAMSPTPDHGEESYRGSGKLTGGAAVITGGDSGIGRAVAIAYAREGADVCIAYLSEEDDAEETARLVRDAGRQAVTFRGDLREEAKCRELIDSAVERFGRMTVLVNNAAYQMTEEEPDDFSSELFDRILKTNIYAPFYLSKQALKHLPRGGSIINTVSIQAYSPSSYLLPYSASKSALVGLTKGLAEGAIEQGVRVNAVAPGPVWTPLIPATMPEDKVKNFGANTVFGRPAQPAELAPMYVWLASPEASYVTGEVYGATGGRSPF
ncbi:putative oxidoreductase YghA [Pseudobythopirellula maris]|uniref:Putative oxidoreductase YghA n=1 Tax=Pseudobythopirellula maris TaxID=2527991 RepID=A0A5C5ZJ92_9BACT|nr:SDR family oxidoreductase [Pseudobythopirellula maris]TWT87248.1 putative oxidoreductase YghA [Pseudobythopirellula maris]